MKNDNLIQYWAHMLDESVRQSYYEVYMMDHPEDKLPTLIDSLIGEFAQDLKKHHFDIGQFIKGGILDDDALDEALDNLDFHYDWNVIKAQTYAAIITRATATSVNAKGQRYNESLSFDDVRRGVSRKKIEECLDLVCHNTNVLEANNTIRRSLANVHASKNTITIDINSILRKHGIEVGMPEFPWHSAIFRTYCAWASFSSGRFEKFVCDSDNGPTELKKILTSYSYAADDLDLVVMLNRAIDTVHARNDLAAAFVEGGARTCSLVSNLPDKFVI